MSNAPFFVEDMNNLLRTFEEDMADLFAEEQRAIAAANNALQVAYVAAHKKRTDAERELRLQFNTDYSLAIASYVDGVKGHPAPVVAARPWWKVWA